MNMGECLKKTLLINFYSITKLNEKYYFFFKSLDKRYKAASILVIIILFINALFEMLSIGILSIRFYAY